MDDEIKYLFSLHVKILATRLNPQTKELHSYAAYALCELITLYSEIVGISYDEAAEILHKED